MSPTFDEQEQVRKGGEFIALIFRGYRKANTVDIIDSIVNPSIEFLDTMLTEGGLHGPAYQIFKDRRDAWAAMKGNIEKRNQQLKDFEKEIFSDFPSVLHCGALELVEKKRRAVVALGQKLIIENKNECWNLGDAKTRERLDSSEIFRVFSTADLHEEDKALMELIHKDVWDWKQSSPESMKWCSSQAD
jgi:hypothetical protein